MVKQEITRVLAVLAAAYPRFEVNELTVQVWLEMLQDIPYDIAQVAAKKLILESPYPPTIADIRKQVADITTPQNEKLDAAEAWGEVERAIRLYGYYRESEALESMSPKTAQAVKWIGWQEICLSDNIGVIRGQFLKMFQQIHDRSREEALLPNSLRDDIASIATRHGLKAIEGGKING